MMRTSSLQVSRQPLRAAGFTLVEMLAALAVAMLFLVLVASITTSSLNLDRLIHGRLSTQRDAKVALDYLAHDFDGLAPAEQSRTTLTVVQEAVNGPGGSSVGSFWIMILSRPTVSSNQGAIRAVSYRLLYNDPMTPGGTKKRLALYRTELTSAMSGFLDQSSLHTNFWSSYWPTYAAANGGKTLLDDYLVESIVDIKVTLNYLDASGAAKSLPLSTSDVINWTSLGFTGTASGASIATPNTPVSITLILTSLRPRGTKLYESGALSLPTAIQREGVGLSRTFPIYSNRVN